MEGWACQNRITRCAVAGESRSKLLKAVSSACEEAPLRLGRAVISVLTVGHCQPAALHKIRIGSGRSPPIRRSTTSIGTEQSFANAATVSSYRPVLAKSTSAASSSLPCWRSASILR
jgi:hypothetical protein